MLLSLVYLLFDLLFWIFISRDKNYYKNEKAHLTYATSNSNISTQKLQLTTATKTS